MKVAVIGAGIAGLRTAQLLERSGHTANVYEARYRVGGRLQTVQVGEGFYEVGGEWIDADHARVIDLLKEFKQSPEKSDERPRRLHFCGQDAWSDEGWPETAIAVEALMDMVPKIRNGTVLFETLAEVLDWVCTDEVSRAYCEAVALSDEGTDSENVDAKAWAEFYSVYENRSEENEEMSAFRFPDGAGELCEKIARSLKSPVMLNHILNEIALEGEMVRLSFTNGYVTEADKCVLAVPPSCINSVILPIKERPSDGIVMSPTCKVVLEFSAPFWENSGWWGHLMSDLLVQQVWPGGRNGLYVLTCYINGEATKKVVGLIDPVKVCLESLATLFPIAKEQFIRGWLHDWSDEIYSGGGFPVITPGAVLTPTRHGPKIYFAGDWTAQWMGFIEGALESAERVVQEVNGG